jgi:hypothetical protein
MGRKKITDGSKLVYVQLPISENNLKIIGKDLIERDFKKMIERTLHNIQKGKVHNQINLIDAIAEIENEK